MVTAEGGGKELDGDEMNVFVSHIVGVEEKGGRKRRRATIQLQYDYGKKPSVLYFFQRACAENAATRSVVLSNLGLFEVVQNLCLCDQRLGADSTAVGGENKFSDR